MRTIADRSILGLLSSDNKTGLAVSSSVSAQSAFADLDLQNIYLYGGGGEVGLQLLITAKDFLTLSSAEVADISSPFLSNKSESQEDLNNLGYNSISDDGEKVSDYPVQLIKKSRRERLSSNIDTDSYKYRAMISDQYKSKKNLDNDDNKINDDSDNSRIYGMTAKSARKARWLTAVSSTGMPIFSSKLLRDYSMLQESKAFFEMLSLYDASPSSFPGELSR